MLIRSLAFVVLAACGGSAAQSGASDAPTNALTPAPQSNAEQPLAAVDAGPPPGEPGAVVPGKVTIVDNVVGTGATAKTGDRVGVHYTGTLTDGTVFDSSRTRGTPFEFRLGSGQVIPGWEQGIAGMKIGGRRTLTIPPDLAYGARGAGGVVPPNAVLVFDVELLSLQ